MKYKVLLVIVMLAVLAIIPISMYKHDLLKSKYQKIKDKHNASMYRETIPILKDWIDKNPDNSESHMLLASAYLNTNDFDFAEERFNSVLILQKNEKVKKFTMSSIGEKYMNALINYLEEDKQGCQYLFNKMLKFADAKTRSIAKIHLTVFCDENMNEQSYVRAHNGYEYLAKLNPSLNKEIGQKHLILFNEVSNQKLKTRIIEDALKFSKENFVTKAYSEYYFALSQKAKTTKEKIEKLRNANRFGGYENELREKQEQLNIEELQKNIGKFIDERGKPDIDVMLTEKGEKHYIFKNPKKRDRFHYLSSGEFTGGDDSGEMKCIYSPNSCRIIGNLKGNFYVTKRNSNVRVVGWKK